MHQYGKLSEHPPVFKSTIQSIYVTMQGPIPLNGSMDPVGVVESWFLSARDTERVVRECSRGTCHRRDLLCKVNFVLFILLASLVFCSRKKKQRHHHHLQVQQQSEQQEQAVSSLASTIAQYSSWLNPESKSLLQLFAFRLLALTWGLILTPCLVFCRWKCSTLVGYPFGDSAEPFALLGIEPTTNVTEVQEAYRRLQSE